MQELLKKNIRLETIDGIFSVPGLADGDYDNKALFYDRVISNTLYNLMIWGNHPKNYGEFARRSLEASDQGTVLDVGCGTLSFTHKVYNKYHSRELVMTDLSLEMLKIGQQHLAIKNNHTFLRADALNLPFEDRSVQTIVSFGFFHVVPDPRNLLKEFWRILKPGGDLHISVLCTDRRLSALFLRLLKKRQLISSSLSSEEIVRSVESMGFETHKKVIGGMAYIDAVKRGKKKA